MGDKSSFARSTQEQAVAAWINYCNQTRLDSLLRTFRNQDRNLSDALTSIDAAFKTIGREIIDRNRGGLKGMHGFIAEVAEEGIGNARSQIEGGGKVYEWVNDNGPADLLRRGVEIQQKFVAAGGRFGLGAVAAHLDSYPDFITNGGRYQLPADHFDVIRKLHAMPRTQAEIVLTRSGDGPSFKDWERVHAFFEEGSVPFASLEPSTLEYPDAQRGQYATTLNAEEESLRATDRRVREDAYRESRPSLQEGVSATLIAGAVEGATAMVLKVVEKRRAGKKLAQFSREDWAEIGGATAFGSMKGGIRGLSIYTLTNFTATPASVASSVVTAGFGIAQQAHNLRRGEIDELQFLESAEVIAIEAAVSALSSLVGQAVIPVPVLGAVLGNAVGTIMFKVTSDALSKREAALLECFAAEQRALDAQLAAEHRELLDQLDQTLSTYLDVLDRAFSPDPAVAFLGSIELVQQLGVPADEVLDSEQKILDYFTA